MKPHLGEIAGSRPNCPWRKPAGESLARAFQLLRPRWILDLVVAWSLMGLGLGSLHAQEVKAEAPKQAPAVEAIVDVVLPQPPADQAAGDEAVDLVAQPVAMPAAMVLGSEQFDMWIFGMTGGIEGSRNRLEGLLERNVDEVARLCSLSKLQQQKLRLAGRGDIKRFFEKVEEKRKTFDRLRNDQNKLGELYQETVPLQTLLRLGLYGDGSMYAKTLNRLVDSDQERRYREALESRQRNLYRAKVELAVAQLDQTMSFTDQQRRGLVDTILKETMPVKHYGQYAYYLVLYQASKIPRAKLKPLFDRRQWVVLERTLNQLRGMEQFLRSQGLLPDHSDVPETVPDFVDALKEPAAEPDQAGAAGVVSTNVRESSAPPNPEVKATGKVQEKESRP